jgi:lipopolysaccharide/colanic/teichoic acid biosynthesis glycosyltransferase
VPDADALKDTLRDLNERQGPLFKITNDPRLTRLGGFLRKYSLDELPQFFNVLKGEMSLVGPRPPTPDEVAQYERYTLEYYRRLDVKPGMTSLWGVQARNDPAFERAFALDCAYIENWSLWMDLKILVGTIPAAFFRGEGR